MEIAVQPHGFNYLRTGRPPDTIHRLLIVDQTGVTVSVSFPDAGWAEFRDYIADPEAAAARQEAREKLVGPNGRAPSIRRQP